MPELGAKKKRNNVPLFFCDPGRIQTFNLLIRSQILYSVELRGLIGCKISIFFMESFNKS